MDVLSPRDSLFDDLLDGANPDIDLVEIDTRRRAPRREPIYSVETVLDGRSAWEAALEDVRPSVAIVAANIDLFRAAQPVT